MRESGVKIIMNIFSAGHLVRACSDRYGFENRGGSEFLYHNYSKCEGPNPFLVNELILTVRLPKVWLIVSVELKEFQTDLSSSL